ncbi:hypothetical protein AXFE_02360 [Acidithrix ferrooxidans]|uniref:Uncharacterized protein n=1 Tax=Acidithrix ferrooxidans TaxID=1280514 RepID=A0A0D8HNZ9_9ACTN|nr:hypothetical protein AXFE_02360 [Acidithrix ferrooxidans]
MIEAQSKATDSRPTALKSWHKSTQLQLYQAKEWELDKNYYEYIYRIDPARALSYTEISDLDRVVETKK